MQLLSVWLDCLGRFRKLKLGVSEHIPVVSDHESTFFLLVGRFDKIERISKEHVFLNKQTPRQVHFYNPILLPRNDKKLSELKGYKYLRLSIYYITVKRQRNTTDKMKNHRFSPTFFKFTLFPACSFKQHFIFHLRLVQSASANFQNSTDGLRHGIPPDN